MQNKTTNIMTFDTLQSLYEDMSKYNQSFTKSENEYVDNKPIIEGGTSYRLVTLDKGNLVFHSNKFGGSELRIVGDIQKAEKVDRPDNDALSEYRLHIIGLNTPFILLACKHRKYIIENLA